jgi:hypothetical protein
MIALIKIAISLLSDVSRFAVLLFRPTGALMAENLFLRRQLALYQERGVRPHRIDGATRISLAWLSRLFDWRSWWYAPRRSFVGTAPVSDCGGVSSHVWGVRRFHWNCAS